MRKGPTNWVHITMSKEDLKRFVDFMTPETDFRLLWNSHIGLVGSIVSLKLGFSRSGYRTDKQSAMYMATVSNEGSTNLICVMVIL